MTRWSDLVAYRCNSCQEPCINERTTARAKYNECADCVSIPSIDRADPVPNPQPPNPSGPPIDNRRYKHDEGAGIPVSEREPRERENTAFLAAPEDSTSSSLEDWPRAPLPRPDGGIKNE